MVKQGYKQTEIGVIPEDWDCAKFGEKVKIYRGGSPRPIQDYITHLSTGINWIKIGDVGENDKYIRSTQEKIIPDFKSLVEKFKSSSKMIKNNTPNNNSQNVERGKKVMLSQNGPVMVSAWKPRKLSHRNPASVG